MGKAAPYYFGVRYGVFNDSHEVIDSLYGIIVEEVQDGCNAIKHQLNVRVIGAIIVGREICQSCSKCRDDVSMQCHDNDYTVLTIG